MAKGDPEISCSNGRTREELKNATCTRSIWEGGKQASTSEARPSTCQIFCLPRSKLTIASPGQHLSHADSHRQRAAHCQASCRPMLPVSGLGKLGQLKAWSRAAHAAITTVGSLGGAELTDEWRSVGPFLLHQLNRAGSARFRRLPARCHRRHRFACGQTRPGSCPGRHRWLTASLRRRYNPFAQMSAAAAESDFQGSKLTSKASSGDAWGRHSPHRSAVRLNHQFCFACLFGPPQRPSQQWAALSLPRLLHGLKIM